MPLQQLKPKEICSGEVLLHIQRCIREVIVPSWLAKPPPHTGLKAAGTLKADNWRRLISIYIPFALMSLCSGQLETTLLHQYVKGVGFRRWLLRPNAPPLLKTCQELLDKAY
ncbi:hypothetical protein GYMLUDRAFT_180893, partial [Collybiopsis luxurians FD-317 M1]